MDFFPKTWEIFREMCVKNKPRTRIFASERNIKNELEKFKIQKKQETTVSIQKRIAVPFLLFTRG